MYLFSEERDEVGRKKLRCEKDDKFDQFRCSTPKILFNPLNFMSNSKIVRSTCNCIQISSLDFVIFYERFRL